MKITQRQKDGFMRIDVIGNESGKFASFDSESWEFFEIVSALLVKELKVEIGEKHDGPDSSRWIGKLKNSQVYFEFDDMLGTTICVDLRGTDSVQIIEDIVQFLKKV